MKAELVPMNGDPPIPITKDLTVVGRRDFCDVRIDHDSLSKRHCVIVKTDGLLVIRDLATTNGTKVKGQKVRWAALLPDDRITLGSYKLRVYLGGDDAPAPSEQAGAAKPAAASQTPAPDDSNAPALAADGEDLEILEEDSDDSGWRKLIGSRRDDNDVIIELE